MSDPVVAANEPIRVELEPGTYWIEIFEYSGQTNPEYTLLASRGCPYWTCTFCSNTLTKPLYEGKGKSFRVRSVEHLVQEMEYAKTLCKNIKIVRFDDEVFPIRKDWIAEMAEKWPKRVGLPFEVLVDPRMVNYESLAQLKEARRAPHFSSLERQSV